MTTRDLAEWVCSITFESLPEEVVAKTKRIVLDCVGASLFTAGRTPWGKTMLDYAITNGGGQPESTVLGSSKKTLMVQAALANGTLAEGFELGDVHSDTATRPFPAVIPAALAIVQARGGSGKSLIEAIVSGYEANTRIGMAIAESQRAGPILGRGLYLPSLIGSFGAAAAAGKGLKLTPERMTWALGIAGALTGGYFQGHDEGAWTRRLNLGMAAERGVTAATLSEVGFVGPERPLEGEYGFYRVFANNEYDLGALTANLGAPYKVMESWLKAYPMNATLHAPCEALLTIMKVNGLGPSEIERIDAFWHQYVTILAKKEVKAVVSAQFSLPYALAVAAVRGKITVEEFAPETIADPAVKAMIGRINVGYDPELYKSVGRESLPGRVILTSKDGREFSETVLYPKGHGRRPMSDEELLEKFRGLTRGLLSTDRQDAIISFVEKLEEQSDVGALLKLCSLT